MRHFKSLGPTFALAGAIGFCLASATVPAQEQEIAPPPGGGEEIGELQGEGYEALTRGPMHEAFASPYVVNPEPGVIVEEPPPEPIDEVPPDQMPAGNNVVWIPGYWGWDPDADEFLWISGLWRDVPTDRRWVPGYWAEAAEGWQWASGFWTSAETEQLAYLPEPPDSLEHGPNIEPPDGDYFWVPGCWIWQEVSYEWRPGYWAPAVADWVWIPDQYVWTPYGCVFVPGYWDYTFVDRGVIFAPVHFETAVYRQPTFRYVPTVVIDTAPLLMHLFVSPTYSHYFYGDYYGFEPTRPRFDFYPWVAYAERPVFYDPLLTYYQWSYGRRDVNLVRRLTVWNQYFIRNEIYRPRRTFAAQQEFLARVEREDIPIQPTVLAFAAPLREFAETRSERIAFREVTQPVRERFVEQAAALQQFQQHRNEFEATADAGAAARRARPGEPGQAAQPAERTLELPEATVVTTGAGRDAAPDRDATPGRDAEPGRDAAPGPDADDRQPAARRELPPRPQPGQQPSGRADEEPGRDAAAGRPGRQRDRRRDTGRQPDPTQTTEPPAEEEPTPGGPVLPRPLDDATRDREQPTTPRTGREPAEPGARRPDDAADRARRDRPQRDRPQDESRPDRPGADLPGVDRPDVTRPERDRPGIDLPSERPREEDGRAGRGLPGDEERGLPPGLRDRPDRGGQADQARPRIPRFGVGRDRQPGLDGGRGGSPDGDATLPGRGRARGRGGFDPFGGLPPGADGSPGLPRRAPEADQPRGRGTRPDLPGRPGAGVPGLEAPRGGQRNRPGAGALPGRRDAPQPSPAPGPGGPQAGPRGPQAGPNAAQPPAAEPPGRDARPERRENREERGRGNAPGRDG